MIRPFLVLSAAAYVGAALNTYLLAGLLPRFLLPDIPFLAIVYAGLFMPGPAGFLTAVPPAFFRELTSSGPPWTFFLASLALFFASREIGLRLFVRTESFILATVGGLLAVESLSLVVFLLLSETCPFSLMWGAEEAVRITWTALLAVPLFMDLSARWQRVQE